MSESKHALEPSPRPWQVTGVDFDRRTIHNSQGTLVATCPVVHQEGAPLLSVPFAHGCEMADANAAFVVRAVNSHADLLAACKDVESKLFGMAVRGADLHTVSEAYKILHDAIALAEGPKVPEHE